MNQDAMILKEILARSRALNIYEKRPSTDKCAELVLYNKDIIEWNSLLTDTLGSAVKPKGVRPTRADKRLTEEYGGIRRNQTLYKKEYNEKPLSQCSGPGRQRSMRH